MEFDKDLLIPTRYDIDYVVQNKEEITRAEAILLGTVLYWTGKKCERGHSSVRYTKSGHCKQCYREFRQEIIEQKDISKDPIYDDTENKEKRALMKLSIVILRHRLKQRDMDFSGTKTMLINRLLGEVEI